MAYSPAHDQKANRSAMARNFWNSMTRFGILTIYVFSLLASGVSGILESTCLVGEKNQKPFPLQYPDELSRIR
jgi:hypothetical protein